MDFKTELKMYQDIVNKELEKYIRKNKCIEKVLNSAMEYSLMAGGKRLRPILVIATYKLFKENIEECMPYAVAIEMVHNFSLIHDDLPGIDNDDFRHGKPTNHKKFNEATAILAGDGLLNNAYMVISNDLRNTKLNIETYNIAVTDDKNVKTTPIMSPSTNIDNIVSDIPIVVIDEGFSLNECSTIPSSAPILYLRPRTICAGIGCKRNMEQKPIEEALLQTLKEEGLHPLSLKCIATIPLKSDELGIIGTAANLNVPLKIIPTEKIEKLDISQLGIATSEFVASQTGVLSVSTACSYLASGKGEILRDKAKYKGITIALSKEKS